LYTVSRRENGLDAAAKEIAEKLDPRTSGAEARREKKGFIAALKALRHPKPGARTAACLKACPDTNH